MSRGKSRKHCSPLELEKALLIKHSSGLLVAGSTCISKQIKSTGSTNVGSSCQGNQSSKLRASFIKKLFIVSAYKRGSGAFSNRKSFSLG